MAEDEFGDREAVGRRRAVAPDGQYGPELALHGGDPITSRGGAGLNRLTMNQSIREGALLTGPTDTRWVLDYSWAHGGWPMSIDSRSYGPVAGLFREENGFLATFLTVEHEDSGSIRGGMVHHLHFESLELQSGGLASISGPLQRCEGMSPWSDPHGLMSCDDTLNIQTARRPALAYDSSTERTIVAWQHQTPNYDPVSTTDVRDEHYGQVMVSVGLAPLITAAQPHQFFVSDPDALDGVRSSVGPGVACAHESQTSYRCIVAYVPVDEAEFEVFVRRFRIMDAGVRWIVDLEDRDAEPIGIQTGSDLAAWYVPEAQEFRVGVRAFRRDQPLHVRRSPDGLSWGPNFGQPTIGPIVLGPQAVPYANDLANTLSYLRFGTAEDGE